MKLDFVPAASLCPGASRKAERGVWGVQVKSDPQKFAQSCGQTIESKATGVIIIIMVLFGSSQ